MLWTALRCYYKRNVAITGTQSPNQEAQGMKTIMTHMFTGTFHMVLRK